MWRASRPKTEAEIAHYQGLLADHLVEPTNMELFVARADGSDMRQVTQLGNATGPPSLLRMGNAFCSAATTRLSADFPLISFW